MPRAALRNIHQRLGDFRNTEVGNRRNIGDEYNEWNDRRGWNDNNSGGPGPGLLPEPHQACGLPPPPPENLDWNAPYQGNRPEIASVRRRDMSPNMGDFMDYNDQPPRGREPEYINEVYVGPERFAPNDFQRVMEPPLPMRNYQDSNSQFRNFDMEPPMSMLENAAPENSSMSSGYRSFEARRGDSNFMESSPTFNNRSHDINPREYSGQGNQDRDQWRPYDQPATMAQKRRREPSPIGPRGPLAPRAGPEISDRVFFIGGYKLPYIRNGEEGLPQPEAKSYTVRFFKKKHNYRFSLNKGKERSSVDHVYIESGDVNDLDDMEGRFSLYRFREDIAKEWTKLYRGRLYRNWDGWWKDFHSINLDIDAQLNKFDGYNVKYNFMPPAGTFNFVEVIKRAHIALTKNRNNYLGNMRVIYGLMDHTLVGNMPIEAVAQLQDIIRGVPNHLWIYKLRCVVYLWYNYSQVMASKNTKDRKYQHVLKEWNSPVIHWVAKQAFVELRNISQVEYPEFSKLYGKTKDVKE